MTIPSSFAVDYTGAATLSIPITVPPGTAGMMPQLSLSYSSSNGNGSVGVGWSLTGLPAIVRCPHTIATNNGVAGPVTLTSYDVFCFQGQPLVQAQQQSAAGQQTSQGQQFEPGQQLIGMSGTYGSDGSTYTTEIESFSRVVSHGGTSTTGPAWFQVYTRSGLIYEFGNTTDSNVQCTASATCASGTAVSWMLDKVTDTVGNTITVTYTQDQFHAYPTEILYTANPGAGLAASNCVLFQYDFTRTDDPVQYLAGQQTQVRGRLDWIFSEVNEPGTSGTCTTGSSGTWTGVGYYRLQYGSGLTGRNRLANVLRYTPSGAELPEMTFSYCDSCGAPADLLSGFSDGLAPSTNLTYALTTHAGVYTPPGSLAVYPSQNLVTPRYVVSSVSAPNGLGGSYVVNYHYYNGLTDMQGRGFLGFNQVNATDAQTQLAKASFYLQRFPEIGDDYNDQIYYMVSPWLLQKNIARTYSTTNAYNSRSFPYVSQIQTTGKDLSGNAMPSESDSYQVDGYGNITSDARTQQFLTSDFGNSNAVISTTTTNTYINNPNSQWSSAGGTNWIIGRLTCHVVSATYTDSNNSANNSGPTTRTTAYSPDATTGFVDSETVQPSSGSCTNPVSGNGYTLTTTFTYDAYGNKSGASLAGDGQTRNENWTYGSSSDPAGEFPDVATNALPVSPRQSETRQFDLRWGLPTQVTDINGETTLDQYDGFGRKTQETRSDGSTISISYLWCNNVNGGTSSCPSTAQYLIQTTHLGKDGSTQMGPTKTTYYDFLNREIERTVQSFQGSLSYVVKAYNTQLQLASVTRPYFAGATPAVTTYTYDPLNRITQTNYPDGSWDTISYSQTAVLLTAGITSTSSGEETWKLFDINGDLVQTNQKVTYNGTLTSLTTNFLRGAFRDLTQVTDPNGNITSYSYDVLGRRTGIQDPDAGTRTNTYDAFDELVSVVDSKGTTSWMTYDALSRMLTRCWTASGQPSGDVQSCPNPSTNEVLETWQYDPTSGIGELGSTTSTQGTGSKVVYTYNSNSTAGLLGKLSTAQYTIGTVNFAKFSYSYDTNSRPSYYVTPGKAEVETIYNAYGYVSALWDVQGSTTTTMWQALGRDAEGHPTSVTYGGTNNIPAANTVISAGYNYDPTTGRMVGVYATAPSSGSSYVQLIGYGWDQFGDLTSRTDSVNGLTENYSYDELNRLTAINIPHQSTLENTFSYDLLGNMLTKLDVGTYTYPPTGTAQPHGVSSITYGSTETNFSYDGNGNLTGESGGTARSLVWTPFNQPSQIIYANKTTTLQYDADEQRTLDKTPEGTTYHFPESELGTSNIWHIYFMVDGQRVAEDYGPPGGPFQHHYFLNDYQNTIGLVVDDTYNYSTSTGIDQNEGSDAFGQPRSVKGITDSNWGANDVTARRYINQQDMRDERLINLNARIYDPLIGRFYSPDPVISDQEDSQSWNSYAYSHNNPMSRADPSGLDDCGNGCPSSLQDIVVTGHRRSIVNYSVYGFGTISAETKSLAIAAAQGNAGARAALARRGTPVRQVTVQTATISDNYANPPESTTTQISVTLGLNESIESVYPEAYILGGVAGEAVFGAGRLLLSRLAAEGTGEATVSLFRAMGQDETESFISGGGYSSGPSSGGKYFAFNLDGPESAMNFATSPFNINLGEMSMSQVNVPESFLENGFRFNDPGGAGASIHFGDEFLSQLNQFGPRIIGQ